MLTNGYNVAVIEDHVAGNPFQNTYSNARHSYYGGGGVPNAWFDGVLNSLGGLGSGSMYSYYLPKVQQRIAIPSDFTIAMNGFNDGLDFTVLVTIENVEPYSGSNLVLQFTLTESHIPHSWGGLTEVNHVNRFMAPDQSGTPLDFSVNNTQAIILEFSLDGSWVPENCEFVAFVQDNDTKEILQGTKVALPDLMPMYFDNATCVEINNLPIMNCSGEVAPSITIANEGAASLTSLDINYKVNDEDLNTYQWTGDLDYGQTDEVQLPALSFTELDENDFIIYTTLPNGNPDEDPANDTLTSAFVPAVGMIPDLYLFLKLDGNPGETTWEVFDAEGTVVKSGGPYADPYSFIKDTISFEDYGCYTFAIYDEGGDGLIENGFYRLRDGNNDEIIHNEEFFVPEEMVEFSFTATAITDKISNDGLRVYPNPATHYSNVIFNLDEMANVELNVYSLTGEVVYQENKMNLSPGSNHITINTREFNPGIYFIKLKAGEKIITHKLSVH